MCKTKMATDAAEPTPGTHPSESNRKHVSSVASTSSASAGGGGAYTSDSSFKLSSGAASLASRTSLSSLRESLPENPHVYDFKEISAATNSFLARRYKPSSKSQSWRCLLRGKDAIVFQRKFRRKITTPELSQRLAVICRSHHTSVIKLLGASISADHIYLVYDFVAGASLADCLRNPRNPNFTVLSSWTSRIRIAADLAHGLDYIHNMTGLAVEFVHNRIRSSSIVVTDDLRARICHFGAAQLCGEVGESGGGSARFEGVMGYVAPETRQSGAARRESDVYAFGVVVLELISGAEAERCWFDKERGEFVRASVVDSAAAAAESGGLRRWVDGRLRDSFPVETAERLVGVALECVREDPTRRPGMGRVAGKVSKLYLESMSWSESFQAPTDITASWAPR